MKCAYEVEEVIRYSTSGKIAGMLAEPIQGFGGVVDPPPEYFKIVYDIVKKHGGIFISDEVQTGFGRTGNRWFGIEQWGVVPDMIAMAKGMGNGVPAGGVITTDEIAESMRGVTHFSTYGGNPVTCVQAKVVIDTIEKYNYKENAAIVGNFLKQRFLELMEKYPVIGDVRGKGLMLGIELVRDRKTREPASAELLKLMDITKEKGLLIGKGGIFGNVVRIKPPLCITMDEAGTLCAILDESIRELCKLGV
jgi:4-aminobutyrate aminotransferase-like enzyme